MVTNEAKKLLGSHLVEQGCLGEIPNFDSRIKDLDLFKTNLRQIPKIIPESPHDEVYYTLRIKGTPMPLEIANSISDTIQNILEFHGVTGSGSCVKNRKDGTGGAAALEDPAAIDYAAMDNGEWYDDDVLSVAPRTPDEEVIAFSMPKTNENMLGLKAAMKEIHGLKMAAQPPLPLL